MQPNKGSSRRTTRPFPANTYAASWCERGWVNLPCHRGKDSSQKIPRDNEERGDALLVFSHHRMALGLRDETPFSPFCGDSFSSESCSRPHGLCWRHAGCSHSARSLGLYHAAMTLLPSSRSRLMWSGAGHHHLTTCATVTKRLEMFSSRPLCETPLLPPPQCGKRTEIVIIDIMEVIMVLTF